MNKEFDFIKNRKVCAIIAACVLLFGLVFNIIFGVKLDTNFKGGTIYTYSFNGEMDEDGVKAIAADVLKTDASVAFSKELTGNFKPGHHYHQRNSSHGAHLFLHGR